MNYYVAVRKHKFMQLVALWIEPERIRVRLEGEEQSQNV